MTSKPVMIGLLFVAAFLTSVLVVACQPHHQAAPYGAWCPDRAGNLEPCTVQQREVYR